MATKRYYTTQRSPIGTLTFVGDEIALSGLFMRSFDARAIREHGWGEAREPFLAALAQVQEFFEGSRTSFDLNLQLEGTPFQLSVWEALRAIPYGETWSYKQLAQAIGNPKAVRAVGLANGRNPISIVVPCHRVIGADGSLTGYGGGLERKAFLLSLEGAKFAPACEQTPTSESAIL